ncbi:hypothetical protein [Nocardia gipuzkoensis]
MSAPDPLEGSTLLALIDGMILYILTHAVFRVVLGMRIYVGRFLAMGVLALLWVIGFHVPGHATLILVAATMATLIVVEALTHADQRTMVTQP